MDKLPRYDRSLQICHLTHRMQYTLDSVHPVMGSALHIKVPSVPAPGSHVKATIYYKTTADCTALQWLAKECVLIFYSAPHMRLTGLLILRQTQGKKFPYLFSQCQPIYMRTLAPVQDTPSVKTVGRLSGDGQFDQPDA